MSVAIQRVSSNPFSTMCTVIVRGTDSSMPTGPSTQPQNTIEQKMITGDRPSPRPISRGSSKQELLKKHRASSQPEKTGRNSDTVSTEE